jgi:hypothetical protein
MLSKQCLQCTGMHVPPTFKDGTVLIDAIFATAGIECVNAYILPHKGGVGDHRCFILNFMSSSFIGTKFLNTVRCSARKLHCKSKRLVQAHNAELDMLCNHHKMYQRFYLFIPILLPFVGHSGISTQKRGTERHLRETTHYRGNERLKNRQPVWGKPRGGE